MRILGLFKTEAKWNHGPATWLYTKNVWVPAVIREDGRVSKQDLLSPDHVWDSGT